MLVTKVRNGEIVEVKHEASGDILRLRIYEIRPHPSRATACIGWDDDRRLFAIKQESRITKEAKG